MKQAILKKSAILCTLFFLLCAQHSVFGQAKTHRKKQTIETKALSAPSDEAGSLKRPSNEKNPKQQPRTRGDVYGSDYSDIIINNFTGYSIDIYVDGSFRGTIAAYDKKVTWAIPGNTRLYAKAVFDDGTYLYWGPTVTYTGYEYTWRLTN